MSATFATPDHVAAPPPRAPMRLQRACACGGHAGISGQCRSCDAAGRFGENLLQGKFTVSAPGDPFELEADRAAEAVVRGGPPPRISALGDRRDEVRREASEAEEEEDIQAKAVAATAPGPGFAAQMQGAGGGAPLPPSARSFFEKGFGRDLGHVRVHDGSTSAELARGINARAFTHGKHIYFGEGQYDDASTEGRRLLAHELAHTVQQGERTDTKLQRQEREVDPAIASLPAERFVDAFSEVAYDLDYRAQGGNLSTWLTVTYPDGVQIDINVYEIADRNVDMVDSMANGQAGLEGRIFPREMTRTTVPRLWAARQEAFQIMEQYNYDFMMAAMPAVIFIITMAGPPPIAASSAPRHFTRPRARLRPRTSTPATGAASAAAATNFRLLSPRVLRFGGRDVVVIQSSRGPQAFYRRTGMGGTNAGGAQAKEWAPFDGVFAGWFDKAKYVMGSADDVLYRFGTEENRRASQWLSEQGIRAGDDIGEAWILVNEFLRELGALKTVVP